MNSLVWVLIGLVALGVVIGTYFFIEGQGYKRGYAAGQHDERQAARAAFDQILRQSRERGLQAQHDIDYLYERARGQVEYYSSGPYDPTGSHH